MSRNPRLARIGRGYRSISWPDAQDLRDTGTGGSVRPAIGPRRRGRAQGREPCRGCQRDRPGLERAEDLTGAEVTGDVVHRLADGVDPAGLAAAETAAGSVPGVVHAHARARWTGRTLRVEIEGWVDPGLTT